MKLIDIKSKKVYYDMGGITYYITAGFWKFLKAGKIKYRTGAEEKGILYTRILTLNIDDDNFEEVFEKIALSTSGEAMMKGKIPITAVL